MPPLHALARPAPSTAVALLFPFHNAIATVGCHALVVLAFGSVLGALVKVCPVAEDFTRVVELAFLPTHALNALGLEPDVPAHAGRAVGRGGWIAQEAPIPAQVKGTGVDGTDGLC